MKYFFLSCLLIFSVSAETLDNIRWGLDIQENVSFPNAETCNDVVRDALRQNGFTPQKTGYYEQGPTIFSVSTDQTQKSIVKCMLGYNLIITTVIGTKHNLSKAEQINSSIESYQSSQPAIQPKPIVQPKRDETQPEVKAKQPFTYFGEQKQIPAPHGHMILASPMLGADVLNQVTQAGTVAVVGYVETAEGKFYISEFSWTQYKAGKDPNWIYIFPE